MNKIRGKSVYIDCIAKNFQTLEPGSAFRVLREYLYETYGDQIYMSLMNQYTPLDTLNREKYPELAKKVTKKAYDVLVDYAIDLGVEQAFIQEGETAKESFIPDFSYEGV